MEKVSIFEDAIIVIIRYIHSVRGVLTVNQCIPSILYTLYGIHKQYSTQPNGNKYLIFNHHEDAILHDLYHNTSQKNLFQLYHDLSQFSYDSYEENYAKIINVFCNAISLEVGRSGSDFFTPRNITQLIAHYVNQAGSKSIYDPFCGTASIVHYLNDNNSKFVGQEISELTSLFARVNYEARYGVDNNIIQGDSLISWNQEHFDAVVSCPPFNLRLSQEQARMLRIDTTKGLHTLEDVFYRRSFEINNSDLVISLEPISFCYSSQYRNIRKYLVDNDLLDTIISFPENTLFSTSIQCVLVICRRHRVAGESVKFYDTKLYNKKDSHSKAVNEFDWKSFVEDIKAHELSFDSASPVEIKGYDYNLNPLLYNYEMVEYEEGQRLVHLGELMEEVRPSRGGDPSQVGLLTSDRYSRNFMEVLLKKDLPLTNETSSRVSRQVYTNENKDTYLLYLGTRLGETRYALYAGSEPFSTMMGARVMKVNKLVEPDYLVYQLLNNPKLKKIQMPITECWSVPLAIDSIQLQQQIIQQQKLNYVQSKEREQEADKKRLGVKQSISDLEHMLGPTQQRIGRMLSRLEENTPDSSDNKSIVKALRDNIDYLNRTIHYSYEEITPESCHLVKDKIFKFIQQYTEAWKNYGGNYFKLDLISEVDENILLKFDPTLMIVLLDSILSNAARHGFDKNSNHTEDNRVRISLTLRSVHDQSFVLISISNNGDPFNKGFGISEYITKGRYDSQKGRSGLGGYHVHQIVKGHHGYMNIDSNKVWNVIIDILLPIENVKPDNIVEYEHDCV